MLETTSNVSSLVPGVLLTRIKEGVGRVFPDSGSYVANAEGIWLETEYVGGLSIVSTISNFQPNTSYRGYTKLHVWTPHPVRISLHLLYAANILYK